jgi:hypothetical protein
MKKLFSLFAGTMLAVVSMCAQTTEDSVRTAVNALFDAMKNSEGEAVRACFADQAVLQTITRNKDGQIMVRNDQVAEFADFVKTQPKGAADERILFETIKIDGPLAIVWTPYQFYYNGTFSHCGVNSFTLVRLNSAWKIQYLIDTRRKTPCN